MTDRDFIFWLRGYLEATSTPDVELIKKMLANLNGNQIPIITRPGSTWVGAYHNSNMTF
jgi:hypothetical protein